MEMIDYKYSRPGYHEPTRTESLYHLLHNCRSSPADTPYVLRDALTETKLTEKNIIQTAMRVEKWAGLLEEAAGITGLSI